MQNLFVGFILPLTAGTPGGVSIPNPLYEAGQAMEVLGIEWTPADGASAHGMSADCIDWAQFQASGDDGSGGYATKLQTDPRLIVQLDMVNALTTSGEVVIDKPIVWTPRNEILLSSPYLVMYGNSSWFTGDMTARMFYKPKKVSEVEFLRLQ